MGDVHDLDHVALAEADRLLDDLGAGRVPAGVGEDPVVSALSAWASDIDADPSLTARARWREAFRASAPVATKVAAEPSVARVRGRALGGAVLALATFTGGSVAAAITGTDVPMFRAVGSALVSGFSGTFPVVDLAPPIRPDLGTGREGLAGHVHGSGDTDPAGLPAGGASSPTAQVELDLMTILDTAIEDGARVGDEVRSPAVTSASPEAGPAVTAPGAGTDRVGEAEVVSTPAPVRTETASAPAERPAAAGPVAGAPGPEQPSVSVARRDQDPARSTQAVAPAAPTPTVVPQGSRGEDRPRPDTDAVPRRGPAPKPPVPTTDAQATPDVGPQALTGDVAAEPARRGPVAGPHDGVPPGHQADKGGKPARGAGAAPGRHEQPSARPASGRPSDPAPALQPGGDDAQGDDAQGDNSQGGDAQGQDSQGGGDAAQETVAPEMSPQGDQGDGQEADEQGQDEQDQQ